jgi:hypothetical protein
LPAISVPSPSTQTTSEILTGPKRVRSRVIVWAALAAVVAFLGMWLGLRHEPAPAPAETPPPAARIESPPGRPPGQHSPKHAAPPAAPAAGGPMREVVLTPARPAENPENLPNPRRTPVRSIDRSNLLAE